MKFYKKGQVMLYIYFIFVAIVITAIAAVIVPMGVVFNQNIYTAGNSLLTSVYPQVSQIQDTEVKSQLNQSFVNAMAATADNISIGTSIFQYSWLIVILLTGLIVFIYTRQLVEVNKTQGGFV